MSSSDENSKGLTPEQEEEQKFKNKYPNSMKPGGSTFVQKMLHRGHKKYFDSGDYNMAKSKNKPASIPPTIVSPSIPTNPSNTSSTSQTPSTPSSTKQQNTSLTSNNSINITNSNLNSINNDLTKHTIDTSSPSSTFSSPTVSNYNTSTNLNNQSNKIDNISTDNLLIDDEIVGHEIPTPECLPRKHSNIQSKLVTSTTTS